MPVRISVYAGEPQHTQTVALGGVQYRLTLTWRERTSSWYADIAAADGTDIVRGRRLSTRWTIMYGLQVEGWQGGDIMVVGREPYEQSDLGQDLQLWYYSAAELAAATADSGSDLVVSL